MLQTNWYKNLIDDLKKLEFTGIVLTKHAIGKRILEDFKKFGNPEYGNKRVENIAKDLDVSVRDIYYCIQFAEKFATPLQNVSWRKVINELLPEPRQKTEQQIEKEKKLIKQLEKENKFNIIYADPPWKYNFAPASSSQIEQHYNTMEIENICNLKIPSADNAVLFLWATTPKLKEALRVLESWGFEYKTNACWNKQTTGMGYWFLGQHELLLVGTKGNFSPPEPEKRVSSVYNEKKTKHSKKPDYFYKLIEQMFPNGKYLELFARKKYNVNWTTWGNECA